MGPLIPGTKEQAPGVIIVATGNSSFNILDRDFPDLDPSPIEFELISRISDRVDLDWDVTAVYEIECTLHFFANCADMYLGENIGRIEKPITTCKYKYEA